MDIIMTKNINHAIDFLIQNNPSDNPNYLFFPTKNSKITASYQQLVCTCSYLDKQTLLKKIMVVAASFSGQGQVICQFLADNQRWHQAKLQWDMQNHQVDGFNCTEVDKLESNIRTLVIFNDDLDPQTLAQLGKVHQDLLIIHITDSTLKINYGANYVTDEINLFCQHVKQSEANGLHSIQPAFLAGSSIKTNAYYSLFDSFRNAVIRHPNKRAIISKKAKQAARDEKQQHTTNSNTSSINDYTEYSYQALYHQVLTYAEVISKHISNKQTVAIFLPRNTEQIITTLASHALGCIVVPIYFDSPIERVKQQIQQSGCHLAIVQENDVDKVSQWVTCVSIENITCSQVNTSIYQTKLNQSEPSFINPLGLDEVSYIYFTSGSEGNPKGVSLCGQSFARLLDDMSFVETPSEQIYSYIANPAFDASAFELWGTFINGATLVVIEKDDLLDVDQLISIFKQHQITTSFFTTGLFNRIVDTKVTLLKELNTAIFGGEKLSTTHLKKALINAPETCFINAYGPTENGIFTTIFQATPASLEYKDVPIGKPVNDTQVAVVDQHHNLLPQGLVGQLVCFGSGLAMGYVNEAELTDKKFVSLTMPNLQPQRGYLTGDYVRLNAIGEIEFVGRIDSQIKLNGFRIELGEIETIITQNHSVQAAYVRFCQLSQQIQVFAVTDEPVDKLLGSFDTLPVYMRPQNLYVVDEIPLNANGKVDQYKLNDYVNNVSTHNDNQPAFKQNELSLSDQTLLTHVVGLYENILCQPVANPELSLFEMGGNSLHLMQLLSDIRTTFHLHYELGYLAQKSSPMDVMRWIALQNWNSANNHEQNNQSDAQDNVQNSVQKDAQDNEKQEMEWVI